MTAQPSTSAHSQQATILTASDVERLLKDDSPDSRASVLEKVARNYNAESFGERERDIAEHIFRMLMKDTALRVRETLAERIKENPSIPRDIVWHMANDVDSVALPILASTEVLSDSDFVKIIEATRDMDKLTTISKRPSVSERVSDALVETKYPDVISSLLGNSGAHIAERSLTKVADEFRNEPQVIAAMAERHPLPMALVERLVNQASAAVAEQLKAKYNLSDEQVDRDASASHDDVMLRMLKHDLPDEEVMGLVRQMATLERLTPSLVMTALCRGQLTFFTAALAHFANVPLPNARKLISDKGDFGFRGLFDRSGLPETMFDAIRHILRVVQSMEGSEAIPGSLNYANRLVQNVLSAADGRDIEYLPYFMALIRQNIARH